MDEIDKLLALVCAGVFGVASVVGLLLWRYLSHFLPRGAVAMDTLTPGTPTTIEFPSGDELDLVLRYTTERRRGQSIAVTVLIEVERIAPAGNGNVMAARYALGLSPQAPKPPNLPFQRIASVSHAVKQVGRASTRSVVLTKIPSGKSGKVTMDLLVSAHTNVTYASFFVKPTRKGLFAKRPSRARRPSPGEATVAEPAGVVAASGAYMKEVRMGLEFGAAREVRGALAMAALLLTFAYGCGGASTRVTYPAELSARSYPRIVVVHGSEPEGIEFANRLARHLHTPRAGTRPSEIFLMHRIQAMQAVAEGTFPSGTVIVDLLFAVNHAEQQYVQHDSCAGRSSGCRPSTTVHSIYDFAVTLTLTVRDSASGRVIQVVTQSEREDGGRRDRNVEVVLRRLQQRIFPMFDPHTRGVRLRVFDVEHTAVTPGLELLREGQWSEARASLEAAVRDPSVLSLPPEQLARTYYALSVARRFDTAAMADVQAHYANARAALDQAIQLDPENDYYLSARANLAADVQRAMALQHQQGAAAINYGEAPVLAPAP